MHKSNMLPGVFSTLIGAFFLYVTLTSSQLPIISNRSEGTYGAGFFPFICSVMILIMGIALTIQGLRQKSTTPSSTAPEEKQEQKQNIRTIVLLLAGLAAMLIAWKLTQQFIFCTYIYSIYLNYILKRSWKFNLIFSTIVVAFIYFMFVKGFTVQFIA